MITGPLMEQFCTPFYRNKMKGIFQISGYLYFSNNMAQQEKTDKNYDRLWRSKSQFHELNIAHDTSKFYSLCERLAVARVMMLFKGRVTSKLCISKWY
jgi:hypothetical protein